MPGCVRATIISSTRGGAERPSGSDDAEERTETLNPTIRIASHGWETHVHPDLGGAILSLAQDGDPVLRPSPTGCAEVLETACWPLVPYANRIAHGRFTFGGERFALPRNFGDHPHSLHGVGWQRPWTVARQDMSSATLVHDHPGDAAWPYRYRAMQHLAVDAGGLSATLDLVNADGRPMPAGLGFHPYFRTDDDSVISFDATGVWLTDGEQLPQSLAAVDTLADWHAGAMAVRDDLVDHNHPGWAGEATVSRGGRITRLRATGAGFVHVHMPPRRNWIGIEPVTTMPDAVNRAEPAAVSGLRILAPGERMTLSMQIARA